MHPTLLSLGLPDILENPEALGALTNEQLDMLTSVRDEASDALEAEPTNEENIDTVYLAHMTLTSALFLRALMNDVQPQALPPAAVLARSWGGTPLRLVMKEDLANMLVPTATIEMLTKAGLPEAAEPELVFDEKPVRLLSVMETLEDFDEPTDEFFGSYWRVGQTAYGDAICVDERADGVVVCLDLDWGFYAQQFVNTSLGHLLLCLEAWRALEADPSDDIDAALEKFERAVERIDPAALTEGAYWADVLESVEDAE